MRSVSVPGSGRMETFPNLSACVAMKLRSFTLTRLAEWNPLIGARKRRLYFECSVKPEKLIAEWTLKMLVCCMAKIRQIVSRIKRPTLLGL